MPVDFTIDEPQRLVLTTAEGELTYAQVTAMQDRRWSDPRFDPQFDHVIDLTAVTKVYVSGEEIRSLLSRDPHRPMASRTAIVASQSFTFGMARMVQGYCAGTTAEVGVFHDIPGALDWLKKTRREAFRAGKKELA